MAPVCVALLVSVAASSILGTSWARNGPRPGSRNPPYYIEVYPEIELNGNLTNHIFFALVQSFGAEFNGSGNIAGVKVAVDRINNDSSMLPSHVLHYTLTDSQCDRTLALEAVFKQLLIDVAIPKLAVLGSGCSIATEPTAEVSHFFNVTHVSCSSASTELTDRSRFRRYFQLLQTMVDISDIYKGLINHYQWEYVSLITQNENLFTVTIDALKEYLGEKEIGFTEKMFASDTGIDGVQDLIDPMARIFIVSSYETHAKAFLCEVYKRGLHYPRYLFILMGWYEGEWWLRQTEEEGLNCTGKQRESILEHALTVHHFNFHVPDDMNTTSGITGSEFKTEEEIKRQGPPEYIEGQFSPYCYDAVWTLAYALNQTLQDFSSDNIQYSNVRFHQAFLRDVRETSFIGITGPVSFNAEGIRPTNDRQVFQMRNEGGETLEVVQVGEVVKRDGEFQFEIWPPFTEDTLWPVGAPRDGIPVNGTVTIHPATTTLFASLASAAMVFTIACLIFNFCFREKKLIKLTSPNLNYLIGAGAILLYIDTYLVVFPSKDPLTVSALCSTINWLTAIGFSLCYGTVICKMIRIHYIFRNPVPQLRATLKDWKLAIGVLVMVTIDLIILVPLTIVEWFDGFEPEEVLDKENPTSSDEIFGVVEYHYAVRCGQSSIRSLFLGFLYGYKGLMQLVALILAFTTRKVKVKGVNDSLYIAAAIYVTSILLVMAIVSSYLLAAYINVYATLFSIGLPLGTTVVIGLVFIPHMVMLYKDPDGVKIFTSTRAHHSGGTGAPESEHAIEVNTLRRRVNELEMSLSQTNMTLSQTNRTLSQTNVNDTRMREASSDDKFIKSSSTE